MQATRCCIAGGGPAGLMLGYLLARAGVPVTVLDDLGLLESFLALPHQEIGELTGEVFGQMVTIADFRHLPAARPFLVLVPQWDFLDFLVREARRFPEFTLHMGAKVLRVLEEGGRVTGAEVQQREVRLGRRRVCEHLEEVPLRHERHMPVQSGQ